MQSNGQSFLKTFAAPTLQLQTPFDVSVVIPSILRPALKRALKSIFEQKFDGRIQILIGVDKPARDDVDLENYTEGQPDHVMTQFFYPGYSTSIRHGGLHDARDGGSLRCLLSYMANSPYVAYLDDDNWWADHHLQDLKLAIRNKRWAYTYRWYVHPDSLKAICIDEWESVGPDKGVYQKRFGGFVDPNSLMINKLKVDAVLRLWNHPVKGNNKGMSADRRVFSALREMGGGQATNKPSSFYLLDPMDENHKGRLGLVGSLYEKAANP